MKYLLSILFFLISINLLAQDWTPRPVPNASTNPNSPGSDWKDRLFTGGNVGLQFGSNQTYVEVSPIIGYRLTDKLMGGLSIRYIYYSVNVPGLKYNTSIYGGGPFARYFLLDNLFAHAEYEVLNLGVADLYNNIVRQNITSVLVGAGYRQHLGSRSALDLLLLWNLNDNINSPYSNPILRMGFVIGL